MNTQLEQIWQKYRHDPPYATTKENSFLWATHETLNSPFSTWDPIKTTVIQPEMTLQAQQLDNMEYLNIIDTDPYFLPQHALLLPHLKNLKLPVELGYLQQNLKIFEYVQGLTLVNSLHSQQLLQQVNQNKTAEKMFANTHNKQLIFFNIINLSGLKYKPENILSITAEQFPALEYLGFQYDARASLIKHLKNFQNLKHIQVKGVLGDLIPELNAHTQTLHIEGAGAQFRLEQLHQLQQLEALYLNSIHTEIDCTFLADNKHLKEITILNSAQFKNVDALLSMENLQTLEMVNCKKVINGDLKQQFYAKQLKSLKIDFC